MAFKYAIALTGGIGTGKSTSSSLFKLGGFKIIDADTIAHRVLANSQSEIKEMFGSQYILDGEVNRSLLGKLIFSDKGAKKRLEEFIHPLIFKEIERESEKLDIFKFPYIIDIPLFFERGVYPIKYSIVVYTPKEIQIERVMARDGFDRDEAIQRIEAQMDIEEKRKRGTFIIDNSLSLKHLQAEVDRVAKEIEKIFIN